MAESVSVASVLAKSAPKSMDFAGWSDPTDVLSEPFSFPKMPTPPKFRLEPNTESWRLWFRNHQLKSLVKSRSMPRRVDCSLGCLDRKRLVRSLFREKRLRD